MSARRIAEGVEFRRGGRHALGLAGALLLAALVQGCATPPPPAPKMNRSYVVLLSDADGKTGQVVVTGASGRAVLDRADTGVRFEALSATPATVAAAEIERDFAPTLEALPKAPVHFLFYFETGSTQLTPASRAEWRRVLDEVASREAPDISITGHTDTSGRAAANEVLGLQRARRAAELLGAARALPPERVVYDSHGESNPLVKTADGVDEPRNRRVEIVVR